MEETPKTINDSKLIAFLGILTVPEMNRLDKFVVSPFFNDKKEVITLFGSAINEHLCFYISATLSVAQGYNCKKNI